VGFVWCCVGCVVVFGGFVWCVCVGLGWGVHFVGVVIVWGKEQKKHKRSCLNGQPREEAKKKGLLFTGRREGPTTQTQNQELNCCKQGTTKKNKNLIGDNYTTRPKERKRLKKKRTTTLE